MTSAITSLLLACVALAHIGGHGVRLEGKGPGGGKLTPVVLASESEMGEKAQTQALAEWFVDGDRLRVIFWDKKRRKPLTTKPNSVKWILAGKELEKPEVVTGFLELKSVLIPKAERVEVILPELGEKKEMQVTQLQLKEPAPEATPAMTPAPESKEN